ncbi:MAG: FtsH protease activity modulator HflK [Nevskia sp.]|nr:FtsH protease activity modulator HflK [Nevskia sp.]
MAWNEPGSNNRDPWSQGSGGKRGDGPPPNFKDLLKKLRFGWRGKGPSGSLLALAGVALLLAWLMAGFYQVDEQEQAVVMRFGAYVGTVGPGAHWHWPPPLEHKKTVNVTNPRQFPVQGEMLTKDMNLVDVSMTIQFRISSVEDYLFGVHLPEETLGRAARSALLEVVARYPIDEVLGVTAGGGAQAAIAAEAKSRLQQIIDSYHCGLLVTDTALKVDPPEAVRADFYEVFKAGEEQKSKRADAQAYAADRLPRARAESAREVAEATAYRDEAIAHAKGDAARFDALLAEYRKSPQVTRKRLYLETMSQIYAGIGKVLLDAGHGNPSVNVPVEQLLNAAGTLPKSTERPSGGGDSAAAPAARGSGAPGSADDSARSRDRESH